MTDQNEKTDVQFLTAEVRSLRKAVDGLTAGLEKMHGDMQKEFAQQGQRVERCTLLCFQLHHDLKKDEGAVPVIEGIAKGESCKAITVENAADFKKKFGGAIIEGVALQSGVVDEHGNVYTAEALADIARKFSGDLSLKDSGLPIKIEPDAEAEIDKLLASIDEDANPAAAQVLPFKKDTCKK